MKQISILGCGWLGRPLAKALVESAYSVKGSTTSLEKLSSLSSEGIEPFLIDLNKGIADGSFFQSETVVIAVPPRLRTQKEEEYLRSMKLAAQLMNVGKVAHAVFVSSTSVYPDLNRVVYEEDADPSLGVTRAEEEFSKLFKGSVAIVRFAGLVGPGRHPGKFLSGKEVSGGDAPVNIIHLTDCVSILLKLVTSSNSVVLNACADEHPTRKVFYTKATEMIGVPAPIFKSAEPIHFKIVSNARLKETLQFEFRYPDPMLML